MFSIVKCSPSALVWGSVSKVCFVFLAREKREAREIGSAHHNGNPVLGAPAAALSEPYTSSTGRYPEPGTLPLC